MYLGDDCTVTKEVDDFATKNCNKMMAMRNYARDTVIEVVFDHATKNQKLSSSNTEKIEEIFYVAFDEFWLKNSSISPHDLSAIFFSHAGSDYSKMAAFDVLWRRTMDANITLTEDACIDFAAELCNYWNIIPFVDNPEEQCEFARSFGEDYDLDNVLITLEGKKILDKEECIAFGKEFGKAWISANFKRPLFHGYFDGPCSSDYTMCLCCDLKKFGREFDLCLTKSAAAVNTTEHE